MTAPVPQAAVVSARAIGQYHRPASVDVVRQSVTCQCGVESTEPDGLELHRAELVAAAVVAAVQGPIKAEALREAADEFEEFAFVDDKRFKTVNTAAVRLNAARILRARADAIEAQP